MYSRRGRKNCFAAFRNARNDSQGLDMKNFSKSSALSFRMREPKEILWSTIAELQPDLNVCDGNFDFHNPPGICQEITRRLLAKGYPFSIEQVFNSCVRLKKRWWTYHRENKPILDYRDSIGNREINENLQMRLASDSELDIVQELQNDRDDQVQNDNEDSYQMDYKTQHAKSFFMWHGKPTNCLLELVKEFQSQTGVNADKNMWTYIQRGMAKMGYSLTTRQIYSKYGSLLRQNKSLIRPVKRGKRLSQPSEARSSIKGEQTINNKFVITEIDDSGLMDQDVHSTPTHHQLDGGIINADLLQELREIKKERAEFHQNVLTFLQDRALRRDERAQRKEQLAIHKYKLLEQFLKQKEKNMSTDSLRM